MTRRSLESIELIASHALERTGLRSLAARAAADCAWLEGVGYPGLTMLIEALADETKAMALEPDALGLDLKNVSCVFLADDVRHHTEAKGRLFLRNVRHGLYLLPESVRRNYGIGCPVDPAFALGGERTKNPYAEKLAAAARDGVEVDDALWQALI